MKLTIKDQVLPTHKPGTYEIEITLMSGDADSYDPFVLGPFEGDGSDDEIMEEILVVVQRMKDAYPRGRGGGGRDNYDNVEGFTELFEGIYGDDYEWVSEPKFWPYNKDEFGFESWPMDKFDYDTHASPAELKIFYYDMDLKKYRVGVTL